MIIKGMHYSETCECEGCKRVSGKSKKIGGTSIHQAIAEDRVRVVEFIKGKSEKVTNDLWYVADQCLEDIPRFFSPLTDK